MKRIYWVPVAGILVAFFVFALTPLIRGEVSIDILAFPGVFSPLFGMYLWHAKKCGIDVLPDGFTYGEPEKSKLVTVKWADIALYEVVAFDEWRFRSFWRGLLHSDSHHADSDQVVLLTLFGGRKIRLMPLYLRQPEFLALLKKMATKAKRK